MAVERKSVRRHLYPLRRDVPRLKPQGVLQIEALHHATRASCVVDEGEVDEHSGRHHAGEAVQQPAPRAIPIRSHKYAGVDGVIESIVLYAKYLRGHARQMNKQ